MAQQFGRVGGTGTDLRRKFAIDLRGLLIKDLGGLGRPLTAQAPATPRS